MPRNEKLVIKFNSIERDVICCNVVSFTAPLKSETPAAPGSVDAYPRIFPTAKTAVVMSCILTSPLPRRFIYLFAFCARSRRVSFLFSSLFFFSFFFFLLTRRCIPYVTMQLPFFLYRRCSSKGHGERCPSPTKFEKRAAPRV